jgi:hypothetical protein
MECDRACAGDIIHCPRCCAELRIPFTEIPGSILRAELILHAPKAPAAPAAAPPPAPTLAAPPPATDAICPICESHLRVRNETANSGAPPLAQLIKKGEPKSTQSNPPDKVEESHPDLAHMTLEERERHIAAVREAHPVQVNTQMKPRLSYVLSGEKPPPPEKPAEEKPPHHSSLTE